MTVREVSFSASGYDRALIRGIADRAVTEFAEYGITSKIDVEMDLLATHANGCPMDFEQLSQADSGNFGHDIGGIRRHLDRETGQLRDCFDPRCSFSSKLVKVAGDVLTTAIESGSDYWGSWAKVERDDDLNVTFAIILNEDEKEVGRVGRSDVIRAMKRILAGECTVSNATSVGNCALALSIAKSDEAHFDALESDAVLQVAVFGEVVYG